MMFDRVLGCLRLAVACRGLEAWPSNSMSPPHLPVAQVWDIGGQALSSRMVANYVYGCQGALLVYDVTSMQVRTDVVDRGLTPIIELHLRRWTSANNTSRVISLRGLHVLGASEAVALLTLRCTSRRHCQAEVFQNTYVATMR